MAEMARSALTVERLRASRGLRASRAGRFTSVQQLPGPLHGHEWHCHGAQPYPDEQVGSGLSPDGREQEGHQRPSAAPHAAHYIQGRLVTWPIAFAKKRWRDENPPPLGGEGSVIEADEAYLGKKEIPQPSKNRRGQPYI